MRAKSRLLPPSLPITKPVRVATGPFFQKAGGMGAEKEKEGHRRVALGHVVAAGVSAFEGATGGAEGASGSGIAVVGVDVQPMDH